MSTENSEFAVPEVVAAEEKEATKEIKGTKRPAEVSTAANIKHPRNVRDWASRDIHTYICGTYIARLACFTPLYKYAHFCAEISTYTHALCWRELTHTHTNTLTHSLTHSHAKQFESIK